MTAGDAPQDHERQWPEQIKLLLDAERPEMEQRLGSRHRVEVPGLAPEHEVGHEACAADDMTVELGQLGRQKLEPADNQASGEHDGERGKEPAHATGIEMSEAELLPLQPVGDDAGDQEARDDEED